MDRNTFESSLKTAVQQAVEFARRYVQQSLSGTTVFRVYPNQSYDGNPPVGDEERFPDQELGPGRYHGPWSLEETITFLWRNGKVPEWIDVSVEAEDGQHTVMSLRCCGRFTATEELLYYRDNLPPFGIKSPVLPPDWNELKSDRFDLHWQEKRKRNSPSIPPRRRWFMFSLKTLFLIVTLLCVWLGWQIHIVRERLAILEGLRGTNVYGLPVWMPKYGWINRPTDFISSGKLTLVRDGQKPARTKSARKLFGDCYAGDLWFDRRLTDADRRAIEAFPEARVYAWPDSP